VDYISYFNSKDGVTVNLDTNEVSGSWANNDTISGFEGISGSQNGSDTIFGTTGANTIKTFGGDDRVFAGKGQDTVLLGKGDDYVKAGGGQEDFNGGSGQDYISYIDSKGGIVIDLEADTVSGSWANNDIIKGFESAGGSRVGGDRMYGTDGANTLNGYGGADKLYGRKGDDTLNGGKGDDYFDGGKGADVLTGGTGADVFHFDLGEGQDIIKDFEDGIDTLQLDNFSFATVEDAFDLATQQNGDVVFNFESGDRIVVENIPLAPLVDDVVLV